MSYFLYCRKSSESEERQALSIPAQKAELIEYARVNNLKIIDVFEEEKSARVPDKRKEFNELITRLKTREATKILCWHTNRLSRNPKESGIIMQMLTDGELEEIRTPHNVINSENCNDILLGVEFGSNSQFSKDLSINTKRGIREKIRRGQWPTYAPAFYLNSGRSNLDKNIIPDPEIENTISLWFQRIINERLTGPQATRLLKELGVKTRRNKFYTESMVYRIVRNPVYYGTLQYSGYEEAKGNWKPYLTYTQWQALQAVFDDRFKPISSKWNHTYQKLLKCKKCGLVFTGYTKVKKSGKKYTYYSCIKYHGDCGNSPITEKELEDQILEKIKTLKISKEHLERLKEQTIKKLGNVSQVEEQKRLSFDNHITQLNKKLDNLLNLRIEGEIEKEEYLKSKKEINDQIQHFESLRNDLKFNKVDIQRTLELFFEFCFSIVEVFKNGLYTEKRMILAKITDSIFLDNKKLLWNFKKPYEVMIESKNTSKNSDLG